VPNRVAEGETERVKKKIALALLLACTLACAERWIVSEAPRGVYHRVRGGETLSGIARAYRVSVQDLAEINNITRPDMITEGRALFIPGADRVLDIVPKETRDTSPPASAPPPPSLSPPEGPFVKRSAPAPAVVRAAPSPTVREASRPVLPAASKRPPSEAEETKAPVRKDGPAPVHAERTPPAGESGSPESRKFRPREAPVEEIRFERQRFIWPFKGPVKTRFGIQPNGLNANGIEIEAREDTPVLAAAGGTVIFSDTLKDYGETIILKHDDEFKTVYIHLKERQVHRDRRVKRGEQIALIGKPEKKREPYWNFEIRYKNKARNPMFFLP